MKNNLLWSIYLFCLMLFGNESSCGREKDIEVEFSVLNEEFIIKLKNVSDSSCYLRTHGGELWWCYSVELWEFKEKGYMLRPKPVFDAEENGAFLGDWGFVELVSGQVKTMKFVWNQIGVSPEILKEVRELLYKNKFRNRVHARPVIVYTNDNTNVSEDRMVIGAFIDVFNKE